MNNKSKTQDMTLPELEAYAQEHECSTKPHYHKDENGFLVQCYHVCHKGLQGVKETLLSPAFWICMTVGYPFEHGLYNHVWPFSILGKLMGH